MKSHRTTFAYSDAEKNMLDRLCDTMGCTASELFRSYVRDKYLKLFPPYAERKVKMIIEEVTDEQFCEQQYGSVKHTDAGNMCYQKIGGIIAANLTSNRVEIKKNGDLIRSLKNT